jgi:hypothetical protein
MGYADQYNAMVAELVRIRGSLGVDSKGWTIPKLSASDMIAVVGKYAAGLAGAIDGDPARKVAHVIVQSKYVSDGIYDPMKQGIMQSAGVVSITSQRYLGGAPIAGAAWKRVPGLSDTELTKSRLSYGYTAPANSIPFEMAREDSYLRSTELVLLGFARQAVDDYQRAIDACSSAAESHGQTPSKNAVSAFLSAIRPLGASIDVLGENPPPTWIEDFKGAMKATGEEVGAALEKGGELAGKAAAGLGNIAGEIGGNFIGGFLSNAGPYAIAIGAYVAWKYI